ncbi:MAG: lysine--tRNA ligase [Actinobacteria bacterium]|nr:lysine--tRNA ligase [Actinomycetota bacterium]MCL5888307.1 lysine--tRNA ligase [Actinomycetota bacterium]
MGFSDASGENERHTELDPVAVRRLKLSAIREAGIEPYPARYEVTASARELHESHADLEPGTSAGETVSLAGRVVAKRDQGRITFLVLRDGTGEIQLFCRPDSLGEQGFEFVNDLDAGDWIGTEGEVMRTRRGELSIAPTSVTLLSKSLRPLPEKYHGLTDTETRYRQRYVDLIANQQVRQVFETRFRIIASMRRFLESRGFIEVETPMLHPVPGGAAARPFVTHHNALDMDLYLRIAPELYLKRLLVGGFERVFEINRSFRNEGMSPRHNPEFTMLEAYQAFTDLDGMMELTESMVVSIAAEVLGTLSLEYQGTQVDLATPWQRRTLLDLVSEACGTEVSFDMTLSELADLCRSQQVPIQPSWGKGKLITELFEKLVEPELAGPVFVTGYPLETSPLARRDSDNPELTGRFELIVNGREIANSFSELVDPIDQRERFMAQGAAKVAGEEEAMSVDEDYLRAMEYGMPPAGGLGIGIDRLVMLLTDSASIRDVLLFPHMRPELKDD